MFGCEKLQISGWNGRCHVSLTEQKLNDELQLMELFFFKKKYMQQLHWTTMGDFHGIDGNYTQ